MSKLRSWLRRRSRKTLVGIALVAATLVLLAGGGVYAALGGTILQSSSASIDLQKGLVGWYKMDGNPKDSSPNRNHGTVSGPTLAADRKGTANAAYSFAGGTDNIQAPGTGVLNLTDDLTISVWVKPTTLSGFNTAHEDIISKRTLNGGGDEPYSIRIRNNGVAVASWKVTTGGDVNGYKSVETAIGVITANNVYHIVLTRDATLACIYINGVSSACSSMAGVSTAGGNALAVNIGGTTSQFSAFTGTMDDLRLYNRAINDAEVMALFEQYGTGVQAASGEKGLMGHWKLDGNANDSSPNRNHGTINGATLTTDRKGASNKAYSFNGTSNFINVPSTSLLTATPANQWSMSAWINPASVSGNRVIMRKNKAGGGYFLRLNGSSLESLFSSSGVSGGSFVNYLAGPVTQNQWQHVVAVYDGIFIRHYINGVQVGSTSAGITLLFDTSPVTIGSRGDGFENFSGGIDDARIYNRALSAAEIKQQYESYDSQINLNSSPTNNTTAGNINQGLIGYWPLNGSAKDSTPYRNNGTVGSASLSTDRFGRANSAYLFGPSNSNIAIPNTTQHDIVVGQARSISAWFKTGTATGSKYIVGRYASCTGWYIAINTNGQILGESDTVASGCSGNVFENAVAADKRYDDNVWHHVVVVYNRPGQSITIYADGQFKHTATLNNTLSGTSGNTQIGKVAGNSASFDGAIDDVRIYDRALSLSEVQALFANRN